MPIPIFENSRPIWCRQRGRFFVMKIIPLRPYDRGYFTIVDDDIHEYLCQWNWHMRNGGYAARPYRVGGAGSSQKLILMHRLVNNTPKGLFTDHINGNKLDNRRENLRTVDLTQSAWNVGKKPYNTSGYIGVAWWKRDCKWTAQIMYGRRMHRVGYFDTKEQAALAFNVVARELKGEYARLNTVPEDVMPLSDQEAFVEKWKIQRHSPRGSQSGYRGVVRHGAYGSTWRARITKNGTTYELGTFGSLEDAALAYNVKAIELYGERAKLNPYDDKQDRTISARSIQALPPVSEAAT